METRQDWSRIDRTTLRVTSATAIEAIAWTWSEFGDASCVLSSMQDSLLIDLAMRVDRRIPVVFLDTGYHFEETHATRRRVEEHYGIEVQVVGPVEPARGDIKPGECCDSKVDLLARALEGRQAWLSGIRRTQTSVRKQTELIGRDRRGKVKVSPLAQWDDQDRMRYLAAHDVITHPLLDRGYTSIGCAPCTSLPNDADARSGRWAASDRTECGLHV